MRRVVSAALVLVVLAVPGTAQTSAEEAATSPSSQVISRRDARLGVGVGTVSEVDASLTVQSRLLGPLSARVGGSLAVAGDEAGTGGFSLGLGVERRQGPLGFGVWVAGWIQTDEGVPTTGSDRPPLASMLSLGAELTSAVDAAVSLYGGARMYVWDDRTQNTVGGVARIGTRIGI